MSSKRRPREWTERRLRRTVFVRRASAVRRVEMGVRCETRRDGGEETACVVQSQTTEVQRDGVASTRIEEVLVLQAKEKGRYVRGAVSESV